MVSRISKIFLFLSGFFPLFLILAIQNYEQYGLQVLIPIVVIVILTVLWLFLFLRLVKRTSPVQLAIANVERKDAEVISHLLTYIFPFLELKFEDLAHLLSLGVFFVVLMILNVNANLIHINPIFNLLGFHIFDIKSKKGTKYTLITWRHRLRRGTVLNVAKIDDDLLMEMK